RMESWTLLRGLLPWIGILALLGCDAVMDDDDDATGDDDSAGDDDDDDDDDSASFAWELCINEFMAANATTIQDDTGVFTDWIELYNMTDEDVDLAGFTITDNLDNPDKHVLAAPLTVPARGHLLLWADGLPDVGAEHLGFQLAREGEELGLYDPTGTVLNHLEYDEQATDWSAARMPDGELDGWVIDATPTPGLSNE
ncbi:MAG: lamin tail domain-containing protein, partial [Myxococcota bacterium]|nr:lamin tail domain-containing protein [Myxococcota bacterium]